MSRILIIGDSWGEGEWTHLCRDHLLPLEVCSSCGNGHNNPYYSVSHRGLEKYLVDHGCYVVNRSRGGCSNLVALNNLVNRNPPIQNHAYDYVFWFVTDPLRDYIQTQNDPKEKFSAHTVDEFNDYVTMHMDKALSIANENAICKSGITIIGGLYIPDLKLVEKYENVHIGCESFTKLFCKEIPQGWNGCNSIPKIENELVDVSESVLDYIDWQLKTFSDLREFNNEYFPAHDSHPNRNAHRILADYLIKKFNLTPYEG